MVFVQRVERPRVGQRFEGFLVNGTEVNPNGKVENIFIGTARLSFFDNGFNSRVARAFDTSQTKANFAFLVHAKYTFRFVHIGTKYRNAEVFTLFEEERNFFDVAQAARQNGGHVF